MTAFARTLIVAALAAWMSLPVAGQSAVNPARIAAFVAANEAERLALLESQPDIAGEPFREALSSTGNEARKNGELANAERHYLALLFIARQRHIPSTEAIAYNNLGIVAGMRGDLGASAGFFQDAMRVADIAGDLRTIQSSWGNLGIVHRRAGDLDLSEVAIRNAVRLAEQIGDKAVIARALNNLGVLYNNRGDGAKSQETYLRSLALKEEVGDQREIAGTLANLGGLFDEQGDYAQALHYYQRGLALLVANGSPAPLMTTALSNIGHLYMQLGDYARARVPLEQARAAGESVGELAATAGVLYNLSTLSRHEGKLDDAERVQQQALLLREKSGDRIGMVETLTALADLAELRGRAIDGLPLAGRAVALASESRLLNQLWKAQLLEGRLFEELGKAAEARAAYEAAIVTIERLRASTAGGDSARRQYLEMRVGPYYALASLHARAGRSFEALAVVEQSRARTLIDIVSSGHTPIRSLTAAQQGRERDLTQRVLDLTAQVDAEARKATRNDQRLAALEEDRERARVARDAFTAELYAQQPDLGLVRAGIPQISPAALSTLVSGGTAVASYLLDEQAAWVYVITGGPNGPTIAAKRLAKTSAEITKAAQALAKQLASRDLTFAASARTLYADLLGPVDSAIAGSSRLIVIPDRALWQVPFQALMSTRGKFVVEEHAISYAPSLSAIAAIEDRRRARPRRPPFLLALGDPALATNAAAAPTRAGDGRLPNAAREVRALGALYGASKSAVLTARDASEGALRAQVERASVLHIATHGVLDDRNPMYSHLRLTPGPALATAPSVKDHVADGRLEAWEVLDLKLSADLAVLSACETARGSFGWGEGLIGLSWSLVAAGASTAVVSQWEVDSASTTKLMIAFHDRLLHSPAAATGIASVPEALQHAALDVMRDPAYRHPFYWAGFISIGAK